MENSIGFLENPIRFLIIPVEMLFLLLELFFSIEFLWELLFSYGIFKGQHLTCQARHTKETKMVNHSLDHDLLFDIYGFLRNCTLFYLHCFIFIERILLRIFPLIDVHSILCKTDNTMFAFTLKSMTWIRKTYIFYSWLRCRI